MKRLACFPLLIPSLLTLPVEAEVKHLSDYGFILENRISTSAKPEAAWQALVSDVGKWWPADHTWWGKSENLRIQAQAGGCFCEIEGEKQALHMLISFAEPGKLLRMTGGLGPLQGMGLTGALDWKIIPSENGSDIILSYKVSGFAPDGFATLAPIVDKVQVIQLGGLGEYLNRRQ
ncbi:SRPBCC domain-containing protein [Aliiglaciecola sp. CAU 1673]|uniref:SRPBCC domain-containing protein n=1 Tax=Aliiglaciecola sp. CAU 1673 TaxID=3032595 RepID=UPI0023DBD803|nr:SRPBCC domain-containing protein [Aliiglaciecola sp. CAU 1673]MDF2179343.1 SRPBCC domain-containing protein [Aliiglaciecola sp. CAU 1673]